MITKFALVLEGAAAHLLHALSHILQLPVIRMICNSAVQGFAQGLFSHPRGVADAHRLEPLFTDFVYKKLDSCVAWRTNEHLTLPSDRFPDRLNQCCCFACAWRPMDERYVCARQNLLHCRPLAVVENRK